MATYTEDELKEMIWRANTNERVIIAHQWIKKHVPDGDMKIRLLKICEMRPSFENDGHRFRLIYTCMKRSQERNLKINF